MSTRRLRRNKFLSRRLWTLVPASNPLGPPAVVLRAIRSSLKQIVHYPDPDCRQLRKVLAQQRGVDPDMILVGNGSTELIHLLPRALRIKSALIIGPTFEEYAVRWWKQAAWSNMFMRRESSVSVPHYKMFKNCFTARRSKFDAVFLCNPNNPTGQVMNRRAMCELAEAVERQQGWLIVDKAYRL